MKQKFFSIWSALAFLAVMTACSKSSPTTPSSTDASGQPAAVTLGKTGVTLTTPSAVSPSDGQQVKFGEQPLKLVVVSAVTSGTTPPAYTFEVATDGGFANIAFSKAGVASSGGNQQSLTIDKLPGSKTYFWRARATVGDAQGLNSKPRSFTIGPEVALQTPTPAAPSQNGTVNGTGVLVTNNVGRSGPVIQVAYKFDVSDSASFGNIVFTTTVAEQQGSQTAATIDANLTNNGTYFWRVQALDAANGVTTPFSSVFSFHYVAFDLNQATILNSPADLANWAPTAKITSVVFTPSAFLVDFDKREGPGRWPDTPFGDGSLEYTLGMCLNLSGHWFCSAAVQFWSGRELEASGVPSNIAVAWFYDPARWGPMTGYQPSDGETVGLFVCAGNCRNNTAGDASYVKERSNVVLVPWSNGGGASFTFSGSRLRKH
jgi:hypothetical protein